MNAATLPAAPAAAQGVKTACPYCGVGCGVVAVADGRGGASIAGDTAHPANFGRLCSKGSALGETLRLDTRLLHPMMGTRRTTWDAALSAIAENFVRIARAHGPESIAFYLSGQMLTEDYYVANKLMKGFLGSANVDTNSRLCMASSVAGHKRAFGSDTVPGTYEDLDTADLFVLVGSNAAWCHPILYQRMIKARETHGAKIVVIDPRGTATSDSADLHLPVRPGMDGVLFSGLLVHLLGTRAWNQDYVAKHTAGVEAAVAAARAIAPDSAAAARSTGIAEADITRFFEMWAATERVVTLYSQGVNQSAQGTDKVNAIINCHLATGRIGRQGMGPFSLTGQPNAMGGREVGGLANQLAAHMGFAPADVDRVGRFWDAPSMAGREGLTAVAMFDAIAEGRIKALWVIGTNPAVSMPRADHVRAALRKLDFFAVSENVAETDTLFCNPQVRLPAAAWGEKDGTVTNSERRITRQRAFLPLPGEALPDWQILTLAARRMGFSHGFTFESAADVFREHAALSGFENDGQRDFDISGLATLTDADYDALAPVQWPVAGPERQSRARFFADGGFYTPDRRARFVAIEPPRLAEIADAAFPLRLNTGRVRDQWHTMTRTGLSPRLGAHVSEPFVAVSPADAARFALDDDGFARVTTPHGEAVLRVRVTPEQPAGQIFAPIHWSAMNSAGGRVGALASPATDPVSHQPELKAAPAALAPVAFKRSGFILSRDAAALPAPSVYAWQAIDGGYGARLATGANPRALIACLARNDAQRIVDYVDSVRDDWRIALVEGDRLLALMVLGDAAQNGSWSAYTAIWTAERLDPTDRRAALSGVAAGPSAGKTVCACFAVGETTIRAAIASGCGSVAAIGDALKAGTNCGSCVPELRAMLAKVPEPA